MQEFKRFDLMRNRTRIKMTHKLLCAMLSNPANVGINPNVLLAAAVDLTDGVLQAVIDKQATKEPAASVPGSAAGPDLGD